jgi:hypothetical protein
MSQDSILYSDESGVRVSKARFIVGSNTYPLNGITSVGSVKRPAKHGGAIWTVIIGLLLAIIGFSAHITTLGIIGILVIAIGVIWYILVKDKYAVCIHTAGGETDAVISIDQSYISKIVAALNDAIERRG